MLGIIRSSSQRCSSLLKCEVRGSNLLLSRSYIQVEQSNKAKHIILNHPKTRNALSNEMVAQLQREIDSVSDDDHCVVIRAVPGPVFSSGHNLKELVTAEGKAVFSAFSNLMESITKCPVPVVAAVDGIAAAAGCQLVAQCDIAICTENSSFSTPGARHGIFCSTPGIALVRNVPLKVANYMLFCGNPISAEEALRAGLVCKVTKNAEELGTELKNITDSIGLNSRAVLTLGKKFLSAQLGMDTWKAYAEGAKVMVRNLDLDDGQEGIRSFMEKRKPKWSHK